MSGRFGLKKRNILLGHDVEIYVDRRLVKRDGKEVNLTKTEYKLLFSMVQNYGEVMTSDEIVMSVWGDSDSHDYEIIRPFMSRLRSKLEDAHYRSYKLIQTIGSDGYRLDVSPKNDDEETN